MTVDELSDEELAALDDQGQVRIIVQTDQGLLDEDQIPQPPQDKSFRPTSEGAVSA